MYIESAKKYLASDVKTPFYLFVGDEQYPAAIDELKVMGLNLVHLSDFCGRADKVPDMDKLLDFIVAGREVEPRRRFVLCGIGEFLALRGRDEALKNLAILKDLNVGKSKVILLLRGLVPLIEDMKGDLRFDERRHYIIDNAKCDLTFTLASPTVGLLAVSGFKAMLSELENGRTGNLVVTTDVQLSKSLFTVKNINSAYEGIKFSTKDFSLPLSCGNDTQWAELLTEMNQNSHSIEAVFEKNGLTENLEDNFYENITGHNYRNWLYFIAIKIKTTSLNNCYLRFVLENCCSFEDFSRHILNDIINVPHTDKRFLAFYKGRKKLVKRFPEPDIVNFIMNNRKDSSESIYRLTDNTLEERKEIISWVSQHGLHQEIDSIYPRLSSYLKRYSFKCSIHAELLTDYFDEYKHQKLLNKLQPKFIEKVEGLARSRKYNQLPTRDEIVDSIEKEGTYLYWLDALGVEYLGFIEDMVRQRGLSAKIYITRAELPTITSINKGFYESWPSHNKKKNASLDEVKHKEAGGYNFTDNQLPIHLAREIDIIQDMIDEAATMLALRRYKRFLIVSDHGASRLAVLRRKEEKYETDTSGEHSGRCCKTFHPYDLPFAAEENGYLVLADYGRFKGSRSANVEVHGGASLEEVVIPVIELSLRDNSITVSLVQETVPVDYKEGAVIQVFINSPVRNNVTVVLGGKAYPGKQVDENHYDIKLHDIKKAGVYSADVYAGDDLIGHISFRTQGKSGKINDDFDNLF